jgi:TRAP-type C4-dicarboxylate transport system permease small subunit
MVALLRAATRAIDTLARTVIWLLTGAMVVLVTLQVFFRYVLNAALSWPEELTRYFMIWSGLLAAVYAHQEGQHVGVTILPDRVGPRARKALVVLGHLAIAGFCLLIAVQGVRALASYAEIQSTALRIPMHYVYSAVPVSFSLLALVSLRVALATFLGSAAPAEGAR